MAEYPPGVNLVSSGQCPVGAPSPMACMFCPYGHMTKCHYPDDCETAPCVLYPAQEVFEDLDALFDDVAPSEMCGFCGCSQLQACPGGCDWSQYFGDRGRAVCTRCETLAMALQCNLQALVLWRDNNLASAPEVK